MQASIEPTPQSLKALAEHIPSGVPVVMLNLLRFREQADYPADKQQAPCSGREAYARYGAAIQPFLKRAQAKVIWQGSARATVIAPQGEAWDDVLLVEYPSKDAFLGMVTSRDYQAITFHRTAALEDSRLVATLAQRA